MAHLPHATHKWHIYQLKCFIRVVIQLRHVSVFVKLPLPPDVNLQKLPVIIVHVN